jgi:hypothetical protein
MTRKWSINERDTSPTSEESMNYSTQRTCAMISVGNDNHHSSQLKIFNHTPSKLSFCEVVFELYFTSALRRITTSRSILSSFRFNIFVSKLIPRCVRQITSLSRFQCCRMIPLLRAAHASLMAQESLEKQKPALSSHFHHHQVNSSTVPRSLLIMLPP